MITGHFIEVSVPEVDVGQDIKATIDFYAINPGALYWATFLVANIPLLDKRMLLDKAREIGEEGGRRKTYNLGKMPNRTIVISFFIFAHDDAGYDWDWDEFDSWLGGYPWVKVTFLSSRTVTLKTAPPTPELYPLEVDITPVGSGYVTTEPAPVDIANHFINGTVGKFTAGVRVLVTAYPNTGYIFSKWSDEIEGGVSYSNPEWVSGVMDEHRAVKAHFIESAEPPLLPECVIDADCPPGYVCENGVCVPAEPIPPACFIDADCPEGYVCRDGVCVPKEEVEIPWTWLALAAAAILLLPKEKPRKKAKK